MAKKKAKRKVKKKAAKKKTAKRKATKKKATKKKATKRKATKKKAKKKATKKKATKKKAAKKKATKKKTKKKAKKKKRKANPAFMRSLSLSPALQDVCGKKSMPRTAVVKAVWAYIKKKGLQDKKNKRNVNCDAKLKAVFKKNQINMFQMMKALNKHMS